MDRSSLRHGSVSVGSPSALWEMWSSALQAHEGDHLLQFIGQSLFSGAIILFQCRHNLAQRDETSVTHAYK